jgi:transcriptional regulator with XRE-family HTH domain
MKKKTAKKTAKKVKATKVAKKFKRVIDPTTAAVGARIRVQREKLGMTIATLAKKLGTSGSSLGQIENGWRTPTADYIDRVAKALGTTRLKLAGLDGRDFWQIVRACDAWDARRK